jgi:chemotaxis protein methyltransferase CheR
MDAILSPTRFRNVIFTAPTRGRLRSAHAIFAPIDLPDDLSPLAYDEETFLRSLFMQAELNIRAYRIETLKRRIPSCLRALRANSLERARWMVRQKPALLKVALNALLIGVSGFFRDGHVFEALRRKFLPELSRGAIVSGLRVWSAGCSDGPELYSVAMLLAEQSLIGGADLLGTDCRSDAVATARAGCYGDDYMQGVPSEMRQRHFDGEGLVWTVKRELRALTRWRSGDVLSVVEPGQWDVILCRNMAMYLRLEAARRLWGSFEMALRPGGLLVLGKAERPDGAGTLSQVAPCIFRRDRG